MFPNGVGKLPSNCSVKIMRMFLINERCLCLWLQPAKESLLDSCWAWCSYNRGKVQLDLDAHVYVCIHHYCCSVTLQKLIYKVRKDMSGPYIFREILWHREQTSIKQVPCEVLLASIS